MGEQRTRCPYCAELILTDAKVCRFCQRWLREDESEQQQAPPVASADMAAPAPTPARVDKSDVELEEPIPVARVQDVKKVADSPKRETKAKRAKAAFPWLRILLFMTYVALIVGCVVMERNALELLSQTKAKEDAGDYDAALMGYERIRDGIPFSFSTVAAHKGIGRVVDQGGLTPHTPKKPPVLGEFIGEDLEGTAVYWLPLAAWPICAILLCLVVFTRILRIGMAFLSLIFCAVAFTGTAIQSSWYGLYNVPQLAEVSNTVMNDPLILFGTTYGLMVITALMTLTRTRRRRRK